MQSRGLQVTHQVLRDILREVQGTMVPEYMLKEWAQYTYSDPTDYWTFRKQVTAYIMKQKNTKDYIFVFLNSQLAMLQKYEHLPLESFTVQTFQTFSYNNFPASKAPKSHYSFRALH